jgi:hypothetical protein
MNAIIFRCYHINGALIDVIEYYLQTQKLNKNTKLILIIKGQLTLEDILSIIKDRYDIDFNFKDNIIILETEYKLIYLTFDNVLIMDYGTTSILSYTFALHYHIIYDHDKKYIKRFYDYIDRPNYIVYNEMPYGMGNIDYKLKFPFEIYKKVKSIKKDCYINCSGKSKTELNRALKLTDKNIIVSGDKSIKTTNRIKVLLKHPKNFFELWDTYMYIHDGMYFEPRCRLLMESYFYNKNIIYDNQYKIKDGSWYRYDELQAIGLDERFFRSDDPIMDVL